MPRGQSTGFSAGRSSAILHLIACAHGWLHYGSNMNADFHVAIYAFAVALYVGWFTSKGDTTHRANTLAFQWRATLTSAGGRVLLAVSGFLAAICLAFNFYWR